MELKVYNTQISFSEIPDEVTLSLNISNCPNHCVGCHSPWLREDNGTELTNEYIDNLIKACDAPLTCVCFMGGDAEPAKVHRYAWYIKSKHNLKTAWYSGKDFIWPHVLEDNIFDYYKFGSYKEERGPLNSKTTNQVMLHNVEGIFFNITHRFQN